MLRIEILQPTTSALNHNSNPIEAPAPIHASLATASHHTQGVILTVGRKNADVIFDNERSVSRAHCRLRVVKLDPMATTEERNVPIQAQSEEEIQECRSAKDGLAIVLEDLGSKFGTKVLTENKSNTTDNIPKDDSETDDETDDECMNVNPTPNGAGITATSSSQVPSSLPPSFLTCTNLSIKTLDKNAKVVLPSLSFRSGSQNDENYVIIQVGNAVFKVTRIRLEFCLSRLQPKEKKELEDVSEMIGANVTSTFDFDTITHLVSPDKSSTAKSISAWAMDIPTVTLDFVRAFASRKSVQDPLPRESDYESPPGLSRIENCVGPVERRKLLGGYKVLSLMGSEGEIMCQCAGATIVPLYRTEQDGKLDIKFWQKDEFFMDLKAQQGKDGLVVTWLDSASKKLKRGRDYLVRIMKELEKEPGSSFRIYCINQMGVARAISDGSNLVDVDHRELVPLKIPRSDGACHSSTGVHEETNDEQQQQQQQQGTEDLAENHQEELSEVQKLSTSLTTDSPSMGPTNVNRDEHVRDVNHVDFRKDDGDKNEKAMEEKDKELAVPQRKRHSNRSIQGQSGWISSSKSKSSSTVEVNEINTEEISQKSNIQETITSDRDQSKYNPTSAGGHHKSKLNLMETDDGWFCAAPQGKQRARFKRSLAELSALGDVTVRNAAETDFCGGLIVRSKKDIENMAGHDMQSRSSRSNLNQKVTDFKRFKKNPIIAGSKMHSISQIHLIPVLPKESERQKELEGIQLELDREQIAADALFSGETGTKRKGIQNYFQATPKSRGRGRSKIH